MIAKRVPTIALLVLCCTTASAVPLPRVHPGSPWYQRIDQATVHPNSGGPTGMIATLNSLGGFGNGRMQIDFGMNVLYAPPGTPTQNVIQIPSGNPDDAYYLPDCEPLASPVPLPAGGAIEGETGYTCDNLNNDCHLLVVQGNEIFEVYRTNVTAQGIQAQCLARWRMDALYPATGRGEHCTSADAAFSVCADRSAAPPATAPPARAAPPAYRAPAGSTTCRPRPPLPRNPTLARSAG